MEKAKSTNRDGEGSEANQGNGDVDLRRSLATHEGRMGNGVAPVGWQAAVAAARKPASYEGDVGTEGSGYDSASEEVVFFQRTVQAEAAAASAAPSKGRASS